MLSYITMMCFSAIIDKLVLRTVCVSPPHVFGDESPFVMFLGSSSQVYDL